LIPFPAFEPDKSNFTVVAGDTLLNCLPVTSGWGPMPDFEALSDALPAACRGLTTFKATDGTLSIFAGTATDLYKLNTSTSPYSWDEVSKTTAAYSVPSGDTWSFTVFGDYLIAHTLGDVPQYISLSAGSAFADLAGTPPTAKYSACVGDFLVFGHLDGEPNKLRWSGLNNSEFWTLGQRFADEQLFPAGGEIQAIVPVGLGAIIIQRDQMQNMQFNAASTYAFSFSNANSARGAISGESVVQIGPGRFFYLSEQGFFAGVEASPIGAERVDRFLFDNIDLDFLPEVFGVADPYNKIAWWKFVTSDGTSRLLGYDWQLDRWCYSDQDLSAGGGIATPGITLDGLDNLYATLDEIPVSLDSRIFRGGRPVFAIIDADSKLSFMAATNKSATIRTADLELSPGRCSTVHSGFVTTDCTDFTVTASTTNEHGGSFTDKAAVSPSTRTGRLPLLADGRLHHFTMVTTAGASWKNALGIDLDFEPGGWG
jgi:hypothetical protein